MLKRSKEPPETPRKLLKAALQAESESALRDANGPVTHDQADLAILLEIYSQNLGLYRHFDEQRARLGNSISIFISLLSIVYVYFGISISEVWLSLVTSIIIVQFGIIWRGSQQKLNLRIGEVYERARSYENFIQLIRPNLPLEEIRNRTRLENKIAENESFWLQNMRRDAIWAYLPNLTIGWGVVLFLFSVYKLFSQKIILLS